MKQVPICKAIRCHRVREDGAFTKLDNVLSITAYRDIKEKMWAVWARQNITVDRMMEVCNITRGLAYKWEETFERRKKEILERRKK